MHDKETKTSTQDRIVFSWMSPDYVKHDKSARWYIVAGIVLALLLVWATLSKNWTMFAAFVVFSAVYLYTHAYHPPKDIKIIVREQGIGVGELFFPYTHIQAFWIIYKPGVKTLNLRITKDYFTDVVIHLNDQDPLPLRQYLVGQIVEWEGKDEQIKDVILRLLKL
jgi:hypothetical protein